MKQLVLCLALLLAVSPFALAQDTLTVTRVIDGNSLVLSDGRKVRLIGVDCPEFKDQGRNKRNAEKLGIDSDYYSGYALKSKNLLEELIFGKEVRTEIDPINKITNHHDKYQRFLAYIYVGDVMVNEALINEGYCVTYRRFQFRFKDDFIRYEQDAKENGRGMWKELDRFSASRQVAETQELITEHDEIARRATE